MGCCSSNPGVVRELTAPVPPRPQPPTEPTPQGREPLDSPCPAKIQTIHLTNGSSLDASNQKSSTIVPSCWTCRGRGEKYARFPFRLRDKFETRTISTSSFKPRTPTPRHVRSEDRETSQPSFDSALASQDSRHQETVPPHGTRSAGSPPAGRVHRMNSETLLEQLGDTPTAPMHPTLSSWLKNMDKVSYLIDHLQQLASATPENLRRQLYRQVDSLRTAFKRQQQRYFEFLRLTEEYADQYLLDISTEIERQSSFLEKLEKRLNMAKALYSQADELRKSYESGTMNVIKRVRKTALRHLLPAESDLFREVESVLDEIRRCYKELDKFWKDEICRADTAFRTRRVDPGDVERWQNFKSSLEQTVESWKDNKQGGNIRDTLHDRGSSGADLGAIASSLFPAMSTLKGSLQRIHESASVECSNMSLARTILRADLGLAQNNKLCFTFFRLCMEFGEMVADSSAMLINHLAFSRVRASKGLLEGAMALGTEVPDVLVKNDSISQGLREFDYLYNQTISLQQKTAMRLNTLVEIVSNWIAVADSLPESFPDGFSLGRLRNLAYSWEKERASMRVVLTALTDDPAEQWRYRCLSSTPPRSCMARLRMNLVGIVRFCVRFCV